MTIRFMVGEVVRRTLSKAESCAEKVQDIVRVLHGTKYSREAGKLQHIGVLTLCVHEWLCIVDCLDTTGDQELQEIEEMYGLSKQFKAWLHAAIECSDKQLASRLLDQLALIARRSDKWAATLRWVVLDTWEVFEKRND